MKIYEPEYFEEEIFFESEPWEEELFDFQYVNDPQEDLYLMETDMIYEEEYTLFMPQETYEEFDYVDFQPSLMEEELQKILPAKEEREKRKNFFKKINGQKQAED